MRLQRVLELYSGWRVDAEYVPGTWNLERGG